jgi:hypothetical protein
MIVDEIRFSSDGFFMRSSLCRVMIIVLVRDDELEYHLERRSATLCDDAHAHPKFGKIALIDRQSGSDRVLTIRTHQFAIWLKWATFAVHCW